MSVAVEDLRQEVKEYLDRVGEDGVDLGDCHEYCSQAVAAGAITNSHEFYTHRVSPEEWRRQDINHKYPTRHGISTLLRMIAEGVAI